MAGVLLSRIITADTLFGGDQKISITAQRDGAATIRRVGLFDHGTKMLVREAWSDSTGAVVFDWLRYQDRGYFAVLFDNDASNPLYNAEIAAFITPVARS